MFEPVIKEAGEFTYMTEQKYKIGSTPMNKEQEQNKQLS